MLQKPIINILFICSSLEPGKDGVGDYTRKLACALIRHGHKAAIIAISEREMQTDVWQGKQCDDGTEINVLRLSEALNWKFRIKTAKKFLDSFNAGWISLQYVPFGYHLKGLPFSLGKNLKQLAPHQRWHIMFHELSVNKNESFKFRLWAFLQVSIIKSFLRTLHPTLTTTNTALYRARLKALNYEAKLLPLFSNITYMNNAGSREFDKLIPEFLLNKRGDYIIGTLFGSFDFKSWDMRSLLNKFSNGYESKNLLIASIGAMPFGTAHWHVLQAEYPHILFFTFGIQEARFISHWLSVYTDFGILTTLPELAGKSGSFMAYKEHGIPVVCRETTPELENVCKTPLDDGLTIIRPEKDFVLLKKYKPVTVLNKVVKEFIEELENSQQSKVNSHSQ